MARQGNFFLKLIIRQFSLKVTDKKKPCKELMKKKRSVIEVSATSVMDTFQQSFNTGVTHTGIQTRQHCNYNTWNLLINCAPLSKQNHSLLGASPSSHIRKCYHLIELGQKLASVAGVLNGPRPQTYFPPRKLYRLRKGHEISKVPQGGEYAFFSLDQPFLVYFPCGCYVTQVRVVVISLQADYPHKASVIACVAGAWEQWRLEVVPQEKTGARRRHARGEGAPSPLACLPRSRPFSLSPTTSKCLLGRLLW